MTRSVPEWIGKTPDTRIPERVKRRILERQGEKCAITGLSFTPKNPPEFDHILALINGGENRESNIQAIHVWEHLKKTKKDVAIKSKNNRVKAKHLGLHETRNPILGSKTSKWKKRMDGTVIQRERKETI